MYYRKVHLHPNLKKYFMPTTKIERARELAERAGLLPQYI